MTHSPPFPPAPPPTTRNRADPDEDPDNDGFSTGQEYEGGTNPLDPGSRPPVDPTTREILVSFDPAGGITLRLERVVGATVTVEISTDLRNWSPAPNPPQCNADGSVEWEEVDPPGIIRFFRVRFDSQ